MLQRAFSLSGKSKWGFWGNDGKPGPYLDVFR